MAGQVVAGEIVRCGKCGKRNRVPAVAAGIPRCGNCHKPLPWIVDSGDTTFADLAERASVPVLVDFWAPWCGPCRMVSPALAQIAAEMAGQIKLVKVNLDESPALQQRFGIQSIPTLMILRQGRVEASQVGAAPAETLRKWVQETLQPH